MNTSDDSLSITRRERLRRGKWLNTRRIELTSRLPTYLGRSVSGDIAKRSEQLGYNESTHIKIQRNSRRAIRRRDIRQVPQTTHTCSHPSVTTLMCGFPHDTLYTIIFGSNPPQLASYIYIVAARQTLHLAHRSKHDSQLDFIPSFLLYTPPSRLPIPYRTGIRNTSPLPSLTFPTPLHSKSTAQTSRDTTNHNTQHTNRTGSTALSSTESFPQSRFSSSLPSYTTHTTRARTRTRTRTTPSRHIVRQ
ncbi:hypothetical protein F5X98DRAFT_4455 [Xylaria grammica]|nr:hypothetical protein F5X98DRAFT_4455 [Xylaria grammica]